MFPDTNILTLLSDNEKTMLSKLASSVEEGGLILEIGCLYGGSTAILALSAPHAHVVSIDDFSWTPEGQPKSSASRTEDNLKSLGVKNSTVIESDSRSFISHWQKNIDLLWIDGGHSFQFVYSDLVNYGKYAKVIALHDYKNPAWDTIERAIGLFLKKRKDFYLAETEGMIAVLRKR